MVIIVAPCTLWSKTGQSRFWNDWVDLDLVKFLKIFFQVFKTPFLKIFLVSTLCSNCVPMRSASIRLLAKS